MVNLKSFDDGCGPISIWVGNLSKYNNGQLFGAWLNLPKEEKKLEEILKIISGSNNDELFIADSENDWGLTIDEYENIENLNEIAELLQKLDDTNENHCKLNFLIDNLGKEVNEAIEILEDVYVQVSTTKTCEDLADEYVEDLIRECLEVPEALNYYIDWRSMARDMEINGEIYTDRFGDYSYIVTNPLDF